MAAHKNDPQAHYRDIIAYQRAVQVAKKYTKSHEKTLLISVSDHETGGLAIGRQLDPKIYPDYVWYPEPIINATRSVEFLSNVTYYAPKEDSLQLESVIREDILHRGLAIEDPSDDIVKDLMAFSRNRTIVEKILSSLVSRSAQVGWCGIGYHGG